MAGRGMHATAGKGRSTIREGGLHGVDTEESGRLTWRIMWNVLWVGWDTSTQVDELVTILDWVREATGAA